MDNNHTGSLNLRETFDIALDVSKKIISGELHIWEYSQQINMILSSPDYSGDDRKNLETYLQEAEARFLASQNSLDSKAIV